MDAMVEPTIGRWFVPAFLTMNKTATDRVREMIRTTPLNGFVGCAQALSDFDLRPGLANVKSPTLFLCGSNDASLPGTKALHAGIAGSKFLEIPNAGHISNVENPAFFTRAIREFLLAP